MANNLPTLDVIQFPPTNSNDTLSGSPRLDNNPTNQQDKEALELAHNKDEFSVDVFQKGNPAPSAVRENLFMVFITLTQLVQMIPLGAGVNSGLAIGDALGASNIQSVWIVASYPLTQGTFVLVGK